MPGRTRAVGAIAGGAVALALVACVPIFTDGFFQTLGLSFRFDSAIPAGEEKVVFTSVFPESVKLRKNFVRVAGRLDASGDDLPSSVTLEAAVASLDSGKVSQRISVRLAVGDGGRFQASTRIKKNVRAGEMMTVTLEPAGGDLPKGTAVTLCVDLVKTRGDLADLPDCLEEPDDGDSDGDVEGATLSSLQSDFFTPSCARIGCHGAATGASGLVLEAGSAFGNLVNVRSQQRPELNRVTPNDPENSYLIKKLRGDPDIVGTRMPQGGAPLTDSQIARFVAWIESGAPNN